MIRLLLALAFAAVAAVSVAAEVTEPTPRGQVVIPEAARPGADFDIERATRAYLDTVPAADRARSDAYFEGGYWLQLWGFLYGIAVAAWLLFGRVSARLRDMSERISKRPVLQTFIYAVSYILIVALVTLPLSFYQEFLREHQYGLSNHSLVGWISDQAKGLMLNAILGSILLTVIYAVVRRRRGNWWLPASVVTVVLYFALIFITPVFVTPLFNDFRALAGGPVRDAVLSLARANGVDAGDVYWFDASRQTKRISANVSGFLATTRISLNDNLLRDTSVPEINAVMAHELGHYVLNHSMNFVLQFGLVITAGLAFAQWAQRRLLARFGERWKIRGPADTAGLPLVIALVSAWFFAMTPVLNSIVRTAEIEADRFGLNAAREPHAFAAVAMRLANYRKLDPSPLEEAIFFDHPSGATRVRTAMQWARENPTAGVGAAR